MFKNLIDDMLLNMWPLILFISVVVITLRGAYLLKGSRKIVLYKEVLSLIFIIYVLCLYHILFYDDLTNSSGINLSPFSEIFRYKIGSYKFIKNVIGNIVLFIPLGFFASYYLSNRKPTMILFVTLIITGCAEGIQYYVGRVFDIDDIILNLVGGFLGYLLYIALTAIKGKLPKFMRSNGFLNFLIISILAAIVLFVLKIDIFEYL